MFSRSDVGDMIERPARRVDSVLAGLFVLALFGAPAEAARSDWDRMDHAEVRLVSATACATQRHLM